MTGCCAAVLAPTVRSELDSHCSYKPIAQMSSPDRHCRLVSFLKSQDYLSCPVTPRQTIEVVGWSKGWSQFLLPQHLLMGLREDKSRISQCSPDTADTAANQYPQCGRHPSLWQKLAARNMSWILYLSLTLCLMVQTVLGRPPPHPEGVRQEGHERHRGRPSAQPLLVQQGKGNSTRSGQTGELFQGTDPPIS